MCKYFNVLTALLTAHTSLICAVQKLENVRIGGLFSLFDMKGSLISKGQQRMSGFLLAVDEINSSEELLPRHKIKIFVKDTKYDKSRAFFTSIDMAKKGVDAVIGAQSSDESNAAATVFNQYSTVQISYSSTSASLSSKLNYRYFARSCPSDTFQGHAMAAMVATQFKWTRVSTFANSDTYGSRGIEQFHSSATKLGVKILSSSLFPSGQTDFTAPINEALRSGARIFVFFMSAVSMGNLLIEGHARGLFGEGTQVIASDACSSESLWAPMINAKKITKEKVAEIMKGVLIFSPYTDYNSSEGSSFLKKFINQKNTARKKGVCNNRMDDDGNYIFQSVVTSANSSRVKCSGVDYTLFNRDGSNLDVYASYAYDATYAIARAMHIVLYERKREKITGSELLNVLINNVSFSGATGDVQFLQARPGDSTKFGEGDRITDIRYGILNFCRRSFMEDPHNISGYERVGNWNEKNGNAITSDITFNTFDNSVPTDMPPPIQLKMTDTQVTLMLFYSCAILTCVAVFFFTLVVFRRTKLVKSILSRLQCIMLGGALCASASIYVGHLPFSDKYCSARVWLSHLSFWLIVAPMMLKTWRVNRILVNNRKYVALNEFRVIQYFMCIMVFVVVYLSILQCIPSLTPRAVTVRTAVRNQVYLDDQCHRLTKGSEIWLYVVEALLLIVTAGLCYATKNVPGELNEAQSNIQAIIVGVLVLAITFPLMLMSPDVYGSTKEFIRSTGTFVAVLCTMCILHGRRSVLLWLDFDIDQDHNLSRKSSVIPAVPGPVVHQEDSVDESKYGGAERNPFQEVKTKKLNYRQQICKQQVSFWDKKMRHTEAMLLGEAEGGAALRIRRIIPSPVFDQPERIPPQAIESDTPYLERTIPSNLTNPNDVTEVSAPGIPSDNTGSSIMRDVIDAGEDTEEAKGEDSKSSDVLSDSIPDPLSPITHQHVQ